MMALAVYPSACPPVRPVSPSAQHPLYRPHQRPKRQRTPSDPLRLFVCQLPLTFPEELLDHPRAGARIPPPVGIELLDERFVEQRLQLPGAQIADRVVPRIDVDKRIGTVVPERR